MAQKKRFVRWLLPDYGELVLKRALTGLIRAAWIGCELVGVEEEISSEKPFLVSFNLLHAFDGHIDPLERLATATEVPKEQMERQRLFADEITKPSSVPHFALALTADEDRRALPSHGPRPTHPI